MPSLRLRHPIVLLHGAAGFVKLPGVGIEYFRGVKAHFEELGNRVLAWKVPNFGVTVEDRARLLLRHLERHRDLGPFNLIAHSMGGLDARHLIASLGGGDLVASLTTVATPHHGTEIAEVRNRILRGAGILPLAQRRGHHFAKEMETFTFEWARRFNEENSDMGGVLCRAWAGAVPLWRTAIVLQPLWIMLERAEGPNDGLVSVRSARWCDAHFAGVIEADHFAQLGWKMGLNRFDGFEHLDFYCRILQDLGEAGL